MRGGKDFSATAGEAQNSHRVPQTFAQISFLHDSSFTLLVESVYPVIGSGRRCRLTAPCHPPQQLLSEKQQLNILVKFPGPAGTPDNVPFHLIQSNNELYIRTLQEYDNQSSNKIGEEAYLCM